MVLLEIEVEVGHTVELGRGIRVVVEAILEDGSVRLRVEAPVGMSVEPVEARVQ